MLHTKKFTVIKGISLSHNHTFRFCSSFARWFLLDITNGDPSSSAAAEAAVGLAEAVSLDLTVPWSTQHHGDLIRSM